MAAAASPRSGVAAAISAPALLEAYRATSAAFHAPCIPAIEQCLERGETDLACSPSASQVVPLVTTLLKACAAGTPCDLTLRQAPGVARAASSLASAVRAVGRLRLIQCGLAGEPATALARALSGQDPSKARLEVLDLADNGLTDGDVAALAGALRSATPRLQALNLEGNAVGDSALAALLPLLPRLAVLSLARCGVDDDLAARLAKALVPGAQSDAALAVLDLSDNALRGAGVVALCTTLTSQLAAQVGASQAGTAGGLAELILAGNALTPDAQAALASTLHSACAVWQRGGRCSLRVLDLTGCRVGGDLAAAAQAAQTASGGALVVHGLHSASVSPARPTVVASPAPASSRQGDPRWAGIVARMQRAVGQLAAGDTAPPSRPGTPPLPSPTATPTAVQAPGTDTPPLTLATVQRRVDEAMQGLRKEFTGDVAVLLEEVAAVHRRLDALEAVVREEQGASLHLLETVMASLGQPLPPRS